MIDEDECGMNGYSSIDSQDDEGDEMSEAHATTVTPSSEMRKQLDQERFWKELDQNAHYNTQKVNRKDIFEDSDEESRMNDLVMVTDDEDLSRQEEISAGSNDSISEDEPEEKQQQILKELYDMEQEER
jgi:hypothetical protein